MRDIIPSIQQRKPVKATTTKPPFQLILTNDIMESSKSKSTFGVSGVSGDGYERDEEQSWKKRKATHPIAHKRNSTKATSGDKYIKAALTDSGYEQDISSGVEAVLGTGYDREEETQVLCFSLLGYVDHSLDPDDDRPFAPLHRKPNFPESLYAILSNPNLSSIVEWMPHGRSFTILDRDEFTEKVLPLYFRHSNFASFNRQICGYGFKKIKLGPFKKTYYHPLFLRNLPHLVKIIKRSSKEKPSEEQSILYESQLERISAERPLPTRMSPVYAKHIKTLNQLVYERVGEKRMIQKHPIIGMDVYTPSPHPFPTVINTQPEEQQSQQLPISYGIAPPQQGTVFTQSHPPLTGVASNQENLLSFLPLQQQLGNTTLQQQLGHTTLQQQLGNTTQAAPALAQTSQAQATAVANEARRQAQIQQAQIQQAQIQLLANAIAAAAGHDTLIQPLPSAQQNSLSTSPALPQPSPVFQDANMNAINFNQFPSSQLSSLQLIQNQPMATNLSPNTSYQPTTQLDSSANLLLTNIDPQAQGSNAQPFYFDASQFIMNPDLNNANTQDNLASTPHLNSSEQPTNRRDSQNGQETREM